MKIAIIFLLFLILSNTPLIGKSVTLNYAARTVYPLCTIDNDSKYILHGASVLVGFMDEGIELLLTNRHVASSHESLFVPITVIFSGGSDTTIVFLTAYAGKSAFYPNWCDSLDLAAIIFHECTIKPKDHLHLPDELYIIDFEYVEDKLPYTGARIFMGGFPFSYGFYSKITIEPVLRYGIISHSCIKRVCSDCIAMHDAFSYAGNSGGPIFVTNDMLIGRKDCSTCVSLIGINIGHDTTLTPLLDVSGKQLPYLSSESTGLSFFIPAQVIKRFLNQIKLELEENK